MHQAQSVLLGPEAAKVNEMRELPLRSICPIDSLLPELGLTVDSKALPDIPPDQASPAYLLCGTLRGKQ